jgi:hypothetical protein
MRAVLFASAMAACFVAVRASNCTSHGRRAPVALGVPDHHHGTDDQHLAQIPIACLGDAAQAHLVARRVRDMYLAVPYASYCLNKSEWSPEGDYFPEGDRLLMFKPEVHTAEWSVT